MCRAGAIDPFAAGSFRRAPVPKYCVGHFRPQPSLAHLPLRRLRSRSRWACAEQGLPIYLPQELFEERRCRGTAWGASSSTNFVRNFFRPRSPCLPAPVRSPLRRGDFAAEVEGLVGLVQGGDLEDPRRRAFVLPRNLARGGDVHVPAIRIQFLNMGRTKKLALASFSLSSRAQSPGAYRAPIRKWLRSGD